MPVGLVSLHLCLSLLSFIESEKKMSDAYWRYGGGDGRQSAAAAQPALAGKRPRSDYDLSGGHELPGYYPREDGRAVQRVVGDTDSINASYERYLQAAQYAAYGGQERSRLGIPSHAVDDHRLASDPRMNNDPRISDPHMTRDPRMGTDPRAAIDPRVSGVDPGTEANGRSSSLVSGRTEISLPRDASNTLYVEGLPYNTSRREVAHIFRPFVGYKEVRLVNKEPRHSGGDPILLCFVDFASPAHAATAKDAIQGYKFDEHDRDSPVLRLQFARYAGARSSGGHHGRR
ncbi:hypothetical protein Droror1_Dr00017645 [Drosera rotundifolia]